MKSNNSNIHINLWKHPVVVDKENAVYVSHINCHKPCPDIDRIITYLQDEAFIGKAFLLTETYEEKKSGND
jgi:hypothetical protein